MSLNLSILMIRNNTNRTAEYFNICMQMLNWLKANSWSSYDPYDAGLSPVAEFLPKEGWWVLQHLVRLSPMNVRPLLRIKKQIHPKALALALQACLILGDIKKEDDMLSTAKLLSEKLMKLAVWDNDRCSWNYPFPYITRVLAVRGSTNIVNTSFIGLALLDAYEKFNESAYIDTALAAARYIIENIGYKNYPKGRICFYYAPGAVQTLTIHNANLICASLLHRLGQMQNNSNLKQLARSAALYSIDYQRQDGLWYYSERPGWRSIDCLHNGFMLDALMQMSMPGGVEPFYSSVKNGLYGFRSFLNEDGSISHILNKPYPKDSRSYSQFIQTASRWSVYDKEWLGLADTAANNALRTMFSENGYCYYRRYRVLTIKTPFARWSVGPMLLALANFIQKFVSTNG